MEIFSQNFENLDYLVFSPSLEICLKTVIERLYFRFFWLIGKEMLENWNESSNKNSEFLINSNLFIIKNNFNQVLKSTNVIAFMIKALI